MTTSALEVSQKVFGGLEVLCTVVGHEFSKFANSKQDVRMCAIGQVHAFPDNSTVQHLCRLQSFSLSGRGHGHCKAKQRARHFDRNRVVHMEVVQNLGSVLLLVNHEYVMISLSGEFDNREASGYRRCQ